MVHFVKLIYLSEMSNVTLLLLAGVSSPVYSSGATVALA